MGKSLRPALHFVGFSGDEYSVAVRLWGVPDFIHPINDPRSRLEVADNDIKIYANKSDLNPKMRNAPDLVPEDPENGV